MNVDAISEIAIHMRYEVPAKLNSLIVECFFTKSHSSAKQTKTDYLLNHEQRHFDIGEIYARIIRKECLHIKDEINHYNFKKLDSIGKYWNEKMGQEQDLYDAETVHSMDHLKQEKWDMDIKKRLADLNEYKSSKYRF